MSKLQRTQVAAGSELLVCYSKRTHLPHFMLIRERFFVFVNEFSKYVTAEVAVNIRAQNFTNSMCRVSTDGHWHVVTWYHMDMLPTRADLLQLVKQRTEWLKPTKTRRPSVSKLHKMQSPQAIWTKPVNLVRRPASYIHRCRYVLMAFRLVLTLFRRSGDFLPCGPVFGVCHVQIFKE